MLFGSCFLYTLLLCTVGGDCIKLNINIWKPASLVDQNFLSVSLDSATIKENFLHTNLARLSTLAEALQGNASRSYIYLRVGGSDADNISYNITNFIMNATEFDRLLKFCYKLRWKLIFDLNSLTRNADGSWDSRNAEELIDYAVKSGYYIDYELGNEPDLYPRHRSLNIPPQQLAKDFKKLKYLLDRKTRHQSRLYGPDMATLTRYNYFARFLSSIENNVLDGVTYHHYYSSSDNITVKNFTSVQYLDSFLLYMQKAKSIIDSSLTNADRVPVWLGETSSTYGGGSSIGMSFAAGFLWLDKLGLAAQMNISVVIRQALKGGKYSLIDKHYRPAPDYWISVLYKRLVGRTVLNVTGFLQLNRSIRVYAHCINPFGKVGYKKYEIVLLILNLNKTDNGVIEFTQDSLKNLEVDQYLFSPSNGNLDDFYVNLNGQKLKMINDTTLPELNPVKIRQPIVVPPLQYGFYVLDGSYAKACMYS